MTNQTEHLCWQQHVKHERRDMLNYNGSNPELLQKASDNLSTIQNYKLKSKFYGKHLDRYMGATGPIPIDPIRPNENRGSFSPLQRTMYLSGQERQRALSTLRDTQRTNPFGSFISPKYQQARQRDIQLKEDLKKTGSFSHRRPESNGSTIFARIAQKTMDRKEKLRLMYSQSNGMTKDKELGIYTSPQKFDYQEHERMKLQKENLLRIVDQIQKEKRRKLEIQSEINSLMATKDQF